MRAKVVVFPFACGAGLLAVWWTLSAMNMFPTGTVPSPGEVGQAFIAEIKSGRLLDNTIASLYRVAWVSSLPS